MQRRNQQTSDSNRLIYAADARKAILREAPRLAYVIDSIPSAPAEEKIHARWEDGHCTNCNGAAEIQSIGFGCMGSLRINYKNKKYCGDCGAVMDGGEVNA